MDKDRKQGYLIKFCCLIAAFSLWLYISSIQNPVITSKLRNVPVQVINTDAAGQSRLVMMPHQEYNVTLTIKGERNAIYSIKPDQFKVVADLSAYALKKGPNTIQVEIKESPQNISIVTSEALWVRVNLDDLAERSVPVKVEIEGKAKEGFAASTPIAKPTDALISGAAQYVNAVKYVLAKGDVKNSDKDLTVTLPLKAVDEAGRNVEEVKIQPGNTEAVIPVKRVKTVGVNVKTTGKLNKDILLTSILPVVDKIDVSGSEAVINAIQALDTENIDLSTLTTNNATIQAKLIVPKDVTILGSNGTIALKVTLDKIVQKTFNMNIQPKNLNENFEMTADITKTSVVVSGSETNLSTVKEEEIPCSIDLSNLDEGEYTVPITVKLPDNINKVSITPQNVKVTIKKKVKG